MGEGRGSPVALTGIPKAWSGGDGEALERLTPIVYAELHRPIGGAPVKWESRNHFFAVSAALMRQVAQKRGEGRRTRTLASDGGAGTNGLSRSRFGAK